LETVDVIPINAIDVRNTIGQKFSRPRTDTTTYVDGALNR
jgi:hypothetical protein